MKTLILIILLNLALVAQAQDSYFEIVQFCEADSVYSLTVSTVDSVYQIRLNPSHSESLEIDTNGAGRYSASIPKDNEWVEVRAFTLETQPIAMLYFEDAPACEVTELSFDLVAFLRDSLPREIPIWEGD